MLTPASNTLSEQLAAFAANLRYDTLPGDVIERVRLHAMDLIGVCLLGAPMPFAAILKSVAAADGGRPESSLLGSGGLRLPATAATLYNGGLAHGNEFDDTYAPGRWHGSAPTVPPALAVAEALHCDGRAFITALAAALEAGCRLTRAAPALLGRGFHSTGTAGGFAATLAVGRLMGLDAERLAIAQGYIDCGIALAKSGVKVEEIERITCIVHPLGSTIMFTPHDMRYRPDNGWSARWSMPFNMAIAFADRRLTVDSYADERTRDPPIVALMDKVVPQEDPGMAFPGDYPAGVRVHLRDGRVLERMAPKVAGTTENPVGADEYEAKFIDNARRGIGAQRADDAIKLMRGMPSLPDMARLAGACG